MCFNKLKLFPKIGISLVGVSQLDAGMEEDLGVSTTGSEGGGDGQGGGGDEGENRSLDRGSGGGIGNNSEGLLILMFNFAAGILFFCCSSFAAGDISEGNLCLVCGWTDSACVFILDVSGI